MDGTQEQVKRVRAALDAGHIAVEVRGHRVTLRGSVAGEDQWRLATRDAWSPRGVQDVENLLEVRPGMQVTG